MSNPHHTPSLLLATLDWSYFPREDTVARLPTVSQIKLCEPCKAFLRGDRTDYVDPDRWEGRVPRPKSVHHNDVNSFQRALELPCDFCVRLHKAMKRTYGNTVSMNAIAGGADLPLVLGSPGYPYPIGPTNYSLGIAREGPARVKFESGAHTASADLEAYEWERSILGFITHHCRVLTFTVARPELHFQHKYCTLDPLERELFDFVKEPIRSLERATPCFHIAGERIHKGRCC